MMTTTDARSAPPPNADPAELSRFADRAHGWWDEDSDLFGPLHRINPLRLGWVEEVAGRLEGRAVLDVGCGGGILSESMAARGANVTGIDLAEKPLAVARLHLLESGLAVDYRLVAVEALAAEQPASFDVVTCMEMLEHVPDPGSVVAACAALARPGATLAFSTLNRNPKSYVLGILGAEYALRLLPRGTHDWSRFIRPSELAAHARAAGCTMKAMTGLVYNPLTRAYRLAGDDTDVNYLAAFVRDR